MEGADRDRLMKLPEIMEVTGMPAGTIRSRYHGGTMSCVWKLGRHLVAWEQDVLEWLDEQRKISTKTEESRDVTRVTLVVRWHPRDVIPYYSPQERGEVLRGWIESALTDRDDGPGIIDFHTA